MFWLLILGAWLISVAWVMLLERSAGDDPHGLQDPDAAPGPVLWRVPPPFDLPASGKGLGS